MAKSSDQIKKTQDSMNTERTRIHEVLEQLITRINKERDDQEERGTKRLRELGEADAARRRAARKAEQDEEKIARAIVE